MKFLFASRIEIYFNVESEKIIDEITVTSIRSFRVPSKIIIEHIYVYINIGRYKEWSGKIAIHHGIRTRYQILDRNFSP